MNMHATDNLQTYPLPEPVIARLRMIDRHAQHAARLGLSVPANITLDVGDFASVDSVVRSVSGHRFNAATVRWNGRGLCFSASAIAA